MIAGAARYRKFPLFGAHGPRCSTRSRWQLPALLLGFDFNSAVVGLYALGISDVAAADELAGQLASRKSSSSARPKRSMRVSWQRSYEASTRHCSMSGLAAHGCTRCCWTGHLQFGPWTSMARSRRLCADTRRLDTRVVRLLAAPQPLQRARDTRARALDGRPYLPLQASVSGGRRLGRQSLTPGHRPVCGDRRPRVRLRRTGCHVAIWSRAFHGHPVDHSQAARRRPTVCSLAAPGVSRHQCVGDRRRGSGGHPRRVAILFSRYRSGNLRIPQPFDR